MTILLQMLYSNDNQNLYICYKVPMMQLNPNTEVVVYLKKKLCDTQLLEQLGLCANRARCPLWHICHRFTTTGPESTLMWLVSSHGRLKAHGHCNRRKQTMAFSYAPAQGLSASAWDTVWGPPSSFQRLYCYRRKRKICDESGHRQTCVWAQGTARIQHFAASLSTDRTRQAGSIGSSQQTLHKRQQLYPGDASGWREERG